MMKDVLHLFDFYKVITPTFFKIKYTSVCFLKSLNKEDPVLYTKDFYMNCSKYNLHL